MTDAAIGHGATFGRGDGESPENFTDISEVLSISGPNLTRETVDATHMGSTDRWREFIGGLKDGGEVSIECNYDPDDNDVTNWKADINANTSRRYKITFPDTTEWEFEAFLTELSPEIPLDDKMVATATYKLTGKPVFLLS